MLKQLTLQKMKDGDDVREHMRRFFDAVDKLHEMEVEINNDLLTIMLLYSLPANFENFRCAIESRDELPTPGTLRVKIAEGNDARRNAEDGGALQNAMIAAKSSNKRTHKKKNLGRKGESTKSEIRRDETDDKQFKFRCHKCREIGHKTIDCKNRRQFANKTEDVSFHALPATRAFKTSPKNVNNLDQMWSIDRGCSSHICCDLKDFVEVKTSEKGTLNLANSAHTDIEAKGVAALVTDVDGTEKSIRLNDALYVPDLRTNLISVGRITDKGFSVAFRTGTAEVIDGNGHVTMVAERVDGLYYVQQRNSNECRSISQGDNASRHCGQQSP